MVAFPDIDPVLLPADGRFGCGPSVVRIDQLEALFTPLLMGTSHRAAPVRSVVASLKEGLRTLLNIPDGYEVVLGNGGASAFWDAACACLISSRAAFGSWGAFGAKFATSAERAPHLAAPLIDEAVAASAPPSEVLGALRSTGLQALPVLNEERHVVGWVSERNLVDRMYRDQRRAIEARTQTSWGSRMLERRKNN